MTFPNSSGGVDTSARSHDQTRLHYGPVGQAAQDIDGDVDWQPDVAVAPSARGPILLLLAVAAALIGAAMLFLLVLRSGDSVATAGGADPAAPLGALDQSEADGDASGPEGFASDASSEGEAESFEGGESADDPAPEALVITPGDVSDSDNANSPDGTSAADPSLAGATADPSTTTIAPTTTAAPTTVSSTTLPPSTQPTSTQPATTQPPPTDPSTTLPPETAATTAPTTAPPAPSGGDGAIQQEVLNLTNAERAANGCGPVVLDPTLNAVADAHSEDMAANNYFDHTGLDGSAPWDRVQAAGYPAGGSGENIAQGYSTAQSVLDGWMNSPGHRRNILNCSWTELGVGYANGSSTRNNIPPIYWTQVFATRR